MVKFCWISPDGPRSGFHEAPPGGLCICSFAFVMKKGELGTILLGRYAVVSDWERLTGLDPERTKRHSMGWTIPASHLKYGEDPRRAAARVVEEVVQIPNGRYKISEPWIETWRWDEDPDPDKDHWDISFFSNVVLDDGVGLRKPSWYEALEFEDLKNVPPSDYARKHQDVVERWNEVKDRMR